MKPKVQTITINVTRSDIDKGIPGDSCECAIALAAKRQLPGAFDCFDVIEPEDNMDVDGERIRIVLKPKKFADVFDSADVDLCLPQRAINFVERFDNTEDDEEAKKKLKPFSFKLKIK